MTQLPVYARALQVLEEYLSRRRAGCAESPEALLAQHSELAEVLGAMLADGDVIGAEAPPPPRWRGLPEEGDDVGGYRIERVLGQGGMGVVFEATDRKLFRKVALKLVRPERLGSPTALERFAREAKLAARLEHPHICPIYEVGEAQGMPFMAMRLLRGETLLSRIAGAGAPPPAAPGDRGSAGAAEPGQDSPSSRERVEATLRLLEQVARAVHFAHEHGIVHRDIKPGNILILPDGTPVVLDFGMARAAADDDPLLTMTGDVAGTPLYMAPEQIVGTGSVGPGADVFALGVTLYEALTGVRPFHGQSLRELQDAILTADPVPPGRHVPGLPYDLDVVVAKALEKDVRLRYASAEALAADLARVQRREPVLARLPGPMLRLGRWAQRNPVAVSLLALGAGVLVTITLLFLWGQAAARDFRLVSLVPRLDDLRTGEARLYDEWPEHEPAMRAWLDRAGALLAETAGVQAALVRLGPGASLEDRFLSETLQKLLRDCDALRAEAGGALPRVRRNVDWIARERAVATAGEAASAWGRAIDAIAAEPLYRGLRLAPQAGLVPLGPDPQSRLYEFLHVRSGSAPERDAKDRLRIKDETGIVLVLLPGGTFTMGSSGAPDELQYEPSSQFEERPAHEVTLVPFFIGKHELTQGQWLRLADGMNPSEVKPGSRYKVKLSLAHPVESVQWGECIALLVQSGLVLPTEAQWEYACRAGTTTPWWTGGEPGSLAGNANVADRAAAEGGLKWLEIDREIYDRYALHGPVDAFAGNAFGLVQMSGNVWEWCRDEYLRYDEHAVSGGDGLRYRELGGNVQRIVRGGAFDGTVMHARSAARRRSEPSFRSFGLGLRAARPVR